MVHDDRSLAWTDAIAADRDLSRVPRRMREPCAACCLSVQSGGRDRRDRCPGPGPLDAEPMESMVQTAAEIIAEMHEAVPRGRPCLTGAELKRLARLTQALVASKPEAQEEYGRFLAAVRKDIDLPGPVLAGCLQGKSVLVTGGTGCIGSALLAQLAGLRPRRLVSVSRGIAGGPRLDGAEYVLRRYQGPRPAHCCLRRRPARYRLPSGGSARPGAGRARGAPHRDHERARHPQRDRRRRRIRRLPGGVRFDRQGPAPVFPRGIHRVQASRRMAAVTGSGARRGLLLGRQVHPCSRQLDHPCPAA